MMKWEWDDYKDDQQRFEYFRERVESTWKNYKNGRISDQLIHELSTKFTYSSIYSSKDEYYMKRMLKYYERKNLCIKYDFQQDDS